MAAASALLAVPTAGLGQGTSSAPPGVPTIAQQIETVRQLEAQAGAEDPRTFQARHLLAFLMMEGRRFAEAEPLLVELAAARARVLGPEHPDTLLTQRDIARARTELGRLDEAARIYEQLLATSTRARGADHPDTLRMLAYFAILRRQQRRIADAEAMLTRAVAGMERAMGPDDGDTNRMRLTLAGFYRDQGRLSDAEALLIRIVETRQRLLGPEHHETLRATGDLAELLVQQRRLAEAAVLLERNLDAGRRVLGPDHFHTLLWAERLSFIYGVEGRLDESEALIAAVLVARERNLPATDRTIFDAVRQLGEVRQQRGRLAEAAALYQRALAGYVAIAGPLDWSVLNLKRAMASLAERQEDFASSARLHGEVLEVRLRLLGPTHPGTIESAGDVAAARLAVAALAPGALEPARLAAAGSRARRAAIPGSGLARAQLVREQTQAAQHFLALADAAWWQTAQVPEAERRSPELVEEVFAALQDATVSTAGQAVVQTEARRLADQVGAGLGALVRERQELDRSWSAVMADYGIMLATASAANQAERQEALARVAGMERRMAELDQRLRRDFPAYHDHVVPQAVDIDEIARLLAPDEALLLIVPSAIGTHIVAVSRTVSQWVHSRLTPEQVGARTRDLLWGMGATFRAGAEEAARLDRINAGGFPRAIAHQLYRELLGPANQVIGGKRHLFVVAAGALSSLPFGLLVTEPPTGGDGDPAALRATRWLADAYALVQLPSVQSLAALRRAPPGIAPPAQGATTFLGFGDPVLQGAPAARARGTARGEGYGAGAGAPRGLDRRDLARLSRLPGTAVELERLRAALGAPAGALYLAERATEANVRSVDLSQARLLAFATHGLVADQLSSIGEPGLVFTPPAAPSERDDGYLTATEVAGLRLDADWVILSACNSAAGDGREGAPGLSGLARAFFYAGARSLLASHWPVADEVAARLTVRTVELLRDQPQLSRAEAFQRAMREVREDGSRDADGESLAHPFYWAPFTLIGDGARRGR